MKTPSPFAVRANLDVGNRDPKAAAFHMEADDIKNDLTGQRPVYPLSCYGPGRDAPRQLIEGPVEISPDELRSRYYTLRLAGNETQAVSIRPFETPLHG